MAGISGWGLITTNHRMLRRTMSPGVHSKEARPYSHRGLAGFLLHGAIPLQAMLARYKAISGSVYGIPFQGNNHA
jgi:hypothetical protein